LRIDVNIIVDTGSQERIIVGHQGRTLVKIRASAVEVLEEILGKDVLLFLWVKSREGKNDQNL
jgi:GTPase Era involved in 16S rRNA processing